MTIPYVENYGEYEMVITDLPDYVLQFTADWCTFCRAVSPLIEDLALQHKDTAFYKIDVDKNPEIAALFDVKTIPHIRRHTQGEEDRVVIGANPKAKTIKELGF